MNMSGSWAPRDRHPQQREANWSSQASVYLYRELSSQRSLVPVGSATMVMPVLGRSPDSLAFNSCRTQCFQGLTTMHDSGVEADYWTSYPPGAGN